MGCFLGCFGSSKVKDERINPRNSQFHSYRNQDKRHQYNSVQNNVTPTLTQIPTVVPNQDILPKPVNLLVPESQFKQEEKEHLSLLDKDNLEEKIQLSSGTRKKVTFDSNVKEYEHISYDEDEVHENMQESEKEAEKKVTEDNLKPITSSSLSEGSTLSSPGSFPPNHRYQNCRVSDDEDDELDCEVSDMDDEEYDDEEVYDDGFSDDEYNSRLVHEYTRSCTSVESRTKSFAACVDDDVYSDRGTKIPEVFNCGARDRAGYVHSVLNPVENTAQWKTVKVKGTPSVKDQKENFQMDLGFQQSSSKSKSKFNEHRDDHEIAVAASLSAWLVSSQSTPPSKANPIGLEPPSVESVSSHGSNYVKSEEERPILGTLTVEELRQFSSTYSPRRPPCRSPNERVLLGTVGVHWNERTNVGNGTSSVSSLNSIPNKPILRANIKRYT